MAKVRICDICEEKLKLQKGEFFKLEIYKIEDFKDYPHNYTSEGIVIEEICKKCKNIIIKCKAERRGK